jgi:hypothetical protein
MEIKIKMSKRYDDGQQPRWYLVDGAVESFGANLGDHQSRHQLIRRLLHSHSSAISAMTNEWKRRQFTFRSTKTSVVGDVSVAYEKRRRLN